MFIKWKSFFLSSWWWSENIAHLAESALRFLELVQENNVNTEQDLSGEDAEETLHPNENYDSGTETRTKPTFPLWLFLKCCRHDEPLCVWRSELQALHEMVQQKVVTLLSDSENIVKQSLMENGITRLCVFFGRQKANDVLLSHMITFLNDKNDWHLRGAFFDSIVGKKRSGNIHTTIQRWTAIFVYMCVFTIGLKILTLLKVFSYWTNIIFFI